MRGAWGCGQAARGVVAGGAWVSRAWGAWGLQAGPSPVLQAQSMSGRKGSPRPDRRRTVPPALEDDETERAGCTPLTGDAFDAKIGVQISPET